MRRYLRGQGPARPSSREHGLTSISRNRAPATPVARVPDREGIDASRVLIAPSNEYAQFTPCRPGQVVIWIGELFGCWPAGAGTGLKAFGKRSPECSPRSRTYPYHVSLQIRQPSVSAERPCPAAS